MRCNRENTQNNFIGREKLISTAGAIYAREKALGETKSKEMAKNI